MNRAGQLSLEYLLITAAFLSAFMLFIQLFSFIYSSSINAVDEKNAELFVSDFSYAVKELSVFGEGSSRTVMASPSGKWLVEISGKSLKLRLSSGKELAEGLSSEVEFPAREIYEKTEFILSKAASGIRVR